MKQSSAIRRILAGLVLLGVLTIGKGAFAAEGRGGFTPAQTKADGSGLVAAAALAVGVAGIPRRKG